MSSCPLCLLLDSLPNFFPGYLLLFTFILTFFLITSIFCPSLLCLCLVLVSISFLVSPKTVELLNLSWLKVALQTSEQLNSHYLKLRPIRVWRPDWLTVVLTGYDWFCELTWCSHWLREVWHISGGPSSVLRITKCFNKVDSNFCIINISTLKSLRCFMKVRCRVYRWHYDIIQNLSRFSVSTSGTDDWVIFDWSLDTTPYLFSKYIQMTDYKIKNTDLMNKLRLLDSTNRIIFPF